MRRRRASVTPVMQHYCALITAELLTWPQISCRRMFGLTLFYRRDRPIVVLPDTKDFQAADRVGFKLYKVSEFHRQRMLEDEHIEWREGAKWITFALQNDGDIALLLRWAEKAYRSCEKGASRRA